MEKKKYHIDNEPASSSDIINKARELDSQFDESNFYQTSVSANILRKNGYTVGNISEIKETN